MWLPGDVDCYVLGDLYQDYDTPLSLAEVLTVTRTVLKENGLLGTWTLGYLYFSGEAGSGQWSNYLYDAEFGNMEFRSGYWETFAKMRGGWRTIFSPKLPITDSSCKMRFVLTLGGLCLFGAGYCLQLLKNPLSMSSILRVKGL
jgi:hypothetical protein